VRIRERPAFKVGIMRGYISSRDRLIGNDQNMLSLWRSKIFYYFINDDGPCTE